MKQHTDLVDEIIDRHDRQVGRLIPIMQDIQDALGYLPEDRMRELARKMIIPLSQVYSVSTFYKSFSLNPRGRHLISVCMGTVCHLKGAGVVTEAICRELNVPVGGTTDDMRFTVQTVNCLGACALAPVVVVGEQYHAKVRPGDVKRLLRSYK